MGSRPLDKVFLALAGLLVIFAIAKIYSSYTSNKKIESITLSEKNLDIIIYSKQGCIYCMKAKELLEKKQLEYKLIELSNNRDLHLKLASQTGQTTVPYIFINNEFIGGFEDFKRLEDEKKL